VIEEVSCPAEGKVWGIRLGEKIIDLKEKKPSSTSVTEKPKKTGDYGGGPTAPELSAEWGEA